MTDPADRAEPTDGRARRRADLTRRAVAAAVAVAREHGLRVDEPVVLNDQFSERDRLLAAHERLAPFAAAPGDTTVLHGDVHPGNLHATGGELRWLDFEDVCRGPVGYDFALLRWMEPTAGDGRIDPEKLARCSDLRAVYLALCMLAFRDAFGDDPEWDGYIRWFVSRIRPL